MRIILHYFQNLQEDTLVFLTQVLMGRLDIVLELANNRIALLNGLLLNDTTCLVLVSVNDPVLKHVLSGCKCTSKEFADMLISCVLASSRTLNIVKEVAVSDMLMVY